MQIDTLAARLRAETVAAYSAPCQHAGSGRARSTSAASDCVSPAKVNPAPAPGAALVRPASATFTTGCIEVCEVDVVPHVSH
jgi:hypothetical protein